MNNPTRSEIIRADCSTVKHRSKSAFPQVRGTGHGQKSQSTGQSIGHTSQHQQNPRSEHRSQHQSAQAAARAPGPPPSLEGGRWLEPAQPSVTISTVRRTRKSPPGRSRYRVDRPRNVITMPAVRDASRNEKDWDEARRLYEVEGWSLREIAGATDVGHETVRRHVIAEGWERDDEAVIARDSKRRAFAQAAVTANVSKWAERRSSEADEAGATAKLARERAVLALIEGDPQMAKAAVIVYGVTIDKAQLLSGGATSRDVTHEEIIERAGKIWDELAERRAS